MNFNDLTKDQIDHVRKIYTNKDLKWQDRMTQLVAYLGKSERTVRKWCSEKFKLKEKPDVEPQQYTLAKRKVADITKKRFIITWCQNNTPVHKKFLANIESYAAHIDAAIHVIAGRYKNPTSIFQDAEEEFWADEVIQYLDANKHDIHKYMSILSHVKIQPTAINPLTSLHSMSGVNSCILGSPKVQLEVIPVLEGCKPKLMLTTGSVSVDNYTSSKAGAIGSFHHTLGFCVVELKDDETFYVRQVTADDKSGSFTDLIHRVEHAKVTTINSLEAIVLGDLHFGHHDQELLDLTMGLVTKIKPNHVICHDIFDGDSISHHTMKDPFAQYGKEINGTNDLGKELEVMMTGLKAFKPFKNVVICRSNHDDFLDRWLKNEDWKKQPTFKNAPLYMELSSKLLRQYAKNPDRVKGIIPELINERFPKYITLDRRSSYKVKNWELGQHGDYGTNGSRGSLLQFRKLNTKCVVGHYHSPQRKDGALSVGTSTHLRVGFNDSASSWCQSHVIIHNDARAQHLIFNRDVSGKLGFTTFKY